MANNNCGRVCFYGKNYGRGCEIIYREMRHLERHGINNYKDTKTVVFTGVYGVYRLKIQSVMLVFLNGFVNYVPSNLLSG